MQKQKATVSRETPQKTPTHDAVPRQSRRRGLDARLIPLAPPSRRLSSWRAPRVSRRRLRDARSVDDENLQLVVRPPSLTPSRPPRHPDPQAGLLALAVAHAAALHFVRAEHFAYAHVADEGMMLEASAGPLLRHRKHWGAENIKIFADVQKKPRNRDLRSASSGPMRQSEWRLRPISARCRRTG